MRQDHTEGDTYIGDLGEQPEQQEKTIQSTTHTNRQNTMIKQNRTTKIRWSKMNIADVQ